jgi:hypothetical protein
MNFKLNIFLSIIFCLLFLSCKTPAFHKKAELKKVLFGLVDDLDSLGLKTGDLLMFQSLTRDGIFTQIGTLSPYTHCALVIRNPDNSLCLLHATDNNFAGERMPVLFEEKSRNGVIMTTIQDPFISVDNGKSGFYKHIRVLRFDESWSERPSREVLLELYEKNKKHPFTASKVPFILSAFDLTFFGHDLISMPDDDSFFCSEFVHHILTEADIPIACDQKSNEYTPKDIRNLEPYQTANPIIFKFKNGKYVYK